MKKNGTTKAWPRLTSRELAYATRAFDDPNYLPPSRKMPAPLQKRHRKALAALRAKAQNQPARSKNNAARVQVTLEAPLLRRADALAASQGQSRSQVVARGLELLLEL